MNAVTGARLIGSMPLPDTETVFCSVARELGPYLARIPDGETGNRGRWIWWQREMLLRHPAMEPDTDTPPFELRQWDGALIRTTDWLRFRSGIGRPAIHGLRLSRKGRRGWRGPSPVMTTVTKPRFSGQSPSQCITGRGSLRSARNDRKNRLPWGMHAALLLLVFASVAHANEPLTGRAACGDWHDDAPGVVRHITPDAMPVPYLTTSARRAPSVVQRPAGAALHVLPGFDVVQFAAGLELPRTCVSHPAAMCSSRKALPVDCAFCGPRRAHPGCNAVFAEWSDLSVRHRFLAAGTGTALCLCRGEMIGSFAFPIRAGDLRPRGKPDIVVRRMPSGGDSTRDLAFSRDGGTMFGRGWFGDNMGTSGEEERADVPAFDADGGHRRIFATRFRNCTARDSTRHGRLWCVVNERDGLGDDLPLEYATSVREGAFYGWPWYYIGDHEDLG